MRFGTNSNNLYMCVDAHTTKGYNPETESQSVVLAPRGLFTTIEFKIKAVLLASLLNQPVSKEEDSCL